MKKWFLRILGGLLGLLLLLFVVGAALPLPADPYLAPEEWLAGASSVEPSYSGLQREFPPVNEPVDNPTSPAKVALGRLLFFDPVLAADNELSCAGCHQPDFGFADGQPLARGRGASGAGPERRGGTLLERHTPALWNAGYASALFWDGRAGTLEEQTTTPLTHADEMDADPAGLVAELQSIPEYVALFDDAFGPGNVSFENVQRALAAFERTLISADSPFDRYAAGEFDALTPQQRRGLTLFRSGATRCFECHAAPTFATNNFRVIGVPSDDPGRGAVADDAPAGAFRVPSLRNVALTAPYMHNGSLATLEEVIRFYAAGGGRANGVENVDVFVQGFDVTDQEVADMIAFMAALTDESSLPEIPAMVPSGLPVVARQTNPARNVAAAANSGPGGGTPNPAAPQEITVAPGETIQAAVDRARPGDTILVPYGLYYERVVVDMSNITLRGVPNENGEMPILDGEGRLADGILSSGNNFNVGNFFIRNYTDNGVLVEGVKGVIIHDIVTGNTGTYGVYPVQSSGVLIERVTAYGVDDAGIYAGQCEDVVVRDSVAYGNVIGIELENTAGGEVYGNRVYDNATGIFIVILPNLTAKVSTNTLVYDNIVENNNGDNFAPEGAVARLLPSGLGVLLLGADNAEVYNNTITGNRSVGTAIFSLTSTGAFAEIDVGPNPEGNYVHNNIYANNGFEPDSFVAALGIPTGDVLWDVSGGGNTFDEPDAQGVFPPLLPGSGWPTPLQRVYFRALNFLVSLVS